MKRAFAAAVMCLAGAGLAIQLVVSIRTSVTRGDGWIYGVWMYVAFFTVLTNLLVAIALATFVIAPSSRIGRWLGGPNAITGIAANIVLVAITYHVALAGLRPLSGWGLIANLLLHYMVPVLYVVFWWVNVPRGSIDWRHAAAWAIYLIAYFFYVMVRGLVSGFYPYPFINLSHLGWTAVAINSLGVLLAFFVILTLLIAIKVSFRATISRETAA